MKCEGKCKKHFGKVKCVWVYSKYMDYVPWTQERIIEWGPFYYCENAVQYNIRKGFKVSECSHNEINKLWG